MATPEVKSRKEKTAIGEIKGKGTTSTQIFTQKTNQEEFNLQYGGHATASPCRVEAVGFEYNLCLFYL